jgi:hypothetical protein
MRWTLPADKIRIMAVSVAKEAKTLYDTLANKRTVAQRYRWKHLRDAGEFPSFCIGVKEEMPAIRRRFPRKFARLDSRLVSPFAADRVPREYHERFGCL